MFHIDFLWKKIHLSNWQWHVVRIMASLELTAFNGDATYFLRIQLNFVQNNKLFLWILLTPLSIPLTHKNNFLILLLPSVRLFPDLIKMLTYIYGLWFSSDYKNKQTPTIVCFKPKSKNYAKKLRLHITLSRNTSKMYNFEIPERNIEEKLRIWKDPNICFIYIINSNYYVIWIEIRSDNNKEKCGAHFDLSRE